MTSEDRVAYLDSSAFSKLVVEEPETPALTRWIAGRAVMTSELTVAEAAHAVHRRLARDPSSRDRALATITRIAAGTWLVPVDLDVLTAAGGFDAPALRTLDAIHVASATRHEPLIEAFVSYDRRQVAAARAVGLPVEQPA